MRRVRLAALSVLVGSVLTACAGVDPGTDPLAIGSAGEPSPESEPARIGGSDGSAPTVAPAEAQAFGLATGLSLGILPADRVQALHFGHILVRDLSGAPFVYVVASAEDASIENPLEADLDALDETASTSIIGADEGASEPYYAAPGTELLRKLRAAITAAGVTPATADIRALSPTSLAVARPDASLVDVETGETLPADAVDARRDEWNRVREDGEALIERDMLRDRWRSWKSEAANVLVPTTESGNLDVARALEGSDLLLRPESLRIDVSTPAEAEQASQPGFAAVDPAKCTTTWILFIPIKNCVVREHGYFKNPAAKQAHRALQRNTFSVKTCNPLSSAKIANSFEGCGPAAMASLIWREWKNGAVFPLLKDFSAKDSAYDTYSYPNAAGKSMQQLLGDALVGPLGSCSFGASGTMTWPSNMKGVNKFLSAQGSKLRVRESISLVGFHKTDARNKLSILHKRVGLNEQPVVAGFDTGGLSGHYAPVSEYKSETWDGRAPDVWVRGFDQGQSMSGWYNISAAFLWNSSLHWLE